MSLAHAEGTMGLPMRQRPHTTLPSYYLLRAHCNTNFLLFSETTWKFKERFSCFSRFNRFDSPSLRVDKTGVITLRESSQKTVSANKHIEMCSISHQGNAEIKYHFHIAGKPTLKRLVMSTLTSTVEKASILKKIASQGVNRYKHNLLKAIKHYVSIKI